MKILRILYYTLRLADRQWALREIDPKHDDVPGIVLSACWYRDRLTEAWAS